MGVMLNFLNRTVIFAVLSLPVFLTHFRGVADGLISYVALAFLLYSALQRDWEWSKQLWFMVALAWWVWIIVCTIPFGVIHYISDQSMIQALAQIRFILFVVALQVWVLRNRKHRLWLACIITGCAGYIILQMLCQFLTGYNLFGVPRYFDGTLTGPYLHPRAAAPLSRILLPITLAFSIFFLRVKYDGQKKGWVLAILILLFSIAIMALAGQRMPFFLFILGLGIAMIWLHSLRPLGLICLLLAPCIVFITSIVSPLSFHHLITHFVEQMSHFPTSHYGMIYTRAIVMGSVNLWAGSGYDAFRHLCFNPYFFQGIPMLGLPAAGVEACAPHPHNHYLEMFVAGGLPCLLLFMVLVVCWLKELSIGLVSKRGDSQNILRKAWRVGIFSSVFIQEWPFASSSSFVNMPLGGWFFLLLGMGLAYSWDYYRK